VLAVGGSVDAAVAYAMLTSLIHFTFASLYSCKGGSVAFKIQPFTVTFFAGLALSPFARTLASILWTKHLAAQAAKLGLLILGLAFEPEHVKLDRDVLKVGLMKHLALPLFTLPFALMSHTKTLLVESSMPPAFMNIALAYVYDYDVALVTKSVITLTLLWIPPFVALSYFFH
jgi:predicted permease